MVTIVMAYHDREEQLLKTLDSFRDYRDIKLVIVNDSDPIKLPSLPFDIDIITVKNKHWINPGVNFNIGFSHALLSKPRFIIIQNPECYHNGDIVSVVRERLTDKNYLSFGCYSLGKEQDVDFKNLNNTGAISNGDSAWYNHSQYRPEALHFCCAITAENLRKINGFDENFANGLGYEDNYLIHQIRVFGLNIEFVDDPFVFHQYHYDKKVFNFNESMYNQTRILCESLKRKRVYRAVHYITEDL